MGQYRSIECHGFKVKLPHAVGGDRDVSIQFRVAAPEDDVEIVVGEGLLRKRFKRVRPSEMLTLKLPAESLRQVTGEIQVSCLKRGGVSA